MRFHALIFSLGAFLLFSGISRANNSAKHNCVAFDQASQHVGAAECVSGTVVHVVDGGNGETLLNFCQEAKACPFTVVVLPGDRKRVGDVRQLEGRQVEIKGTIEDYEGHAQIVLRHTQQLGESAYVVVPPVPTDYDVERAGHYSAGKFRRPKAAKKKHPKQGAPVSIEDPGEPQ